jgi:hypothetical protein
MDETGVMLSMLNSAKVLVGKDDTNAYIGARVNRAVVVAVECISADGRCSSTFEFGFVWHSEDQTVQQPRTITWSQCRTVNCGWSANKQANELWNRAVSWWLCSLNNCVVGKVLSYRSNARWSFAAAAGWLVVLATVV